MVTVQNLSPIIPTTGMIPLKNTLVTWLTPDFDARERSDRPRGMDMLYVDDTAGKNDYVTEPLRALWMIREINRDLRYAGTLTLHDRDAAPELLSNELILEAGPYVRLNYIYDSLQTAPVDIGIAIHAGLAHDTLADIFRDGVTAGGIVLVQDQVSSTFRGPDKQQAYAAHLMLSSYRDGFIQREIVKSPVFDDQTDDSVLLVMERT